MSNKTTILFYYKMIIRELAISEHETSLPVSNLRMYMASWMCLWLVLVDKCRMTPLRVRALSLIMQKKLSMRSFTTIRPRVLAELPPLARIAEIRRAQTLAS